MLNSADFECSDADPTGRGKGSGEIGDKEKQVKGDGGQSQKEKQKRSQGDKEMAANHVMTLGGSWESDERFPMDRLVS
jgi:hypothetical protein